MSVSIKLLGRLTIIAITALLTSGCANTAVKNASYNLAENGKAPFGSDRLRSSRGSKSDKAPKGSFTKAPEGAFDYRNYSGTKLNTKAALRMINRYRKSKGLKPLVYNHTLARAALSHAKDLSRHDRISHYGFDGSDPWKRVKRAGYHPMLAAENVGTGQISLAEVFKGWQDSPGHDKNLLLSDATQMGIALVKNHKSNYKTFWVLKLGTPAKS